jgi:hypothetical protein
VITRLCEQYRGTVHLFIGAGRSLWEITIMPLIRDYNSDSNIYGLKGHSTFMSVCKFRSFTKRNLRSSHADSFSRSCFFLPDLRRRSIVPTIILITTCKPNISDEVSLINGAPLATHNREHGWYISFITHCRGCALYPQAVISSCLGPIKPLNTTKVNRQGFTT